MPKTPQMRTLEALFRKDIDAIIEDAYRASADRRLPGDRYSQTLMHTATRLGISRSTLYTWLGSLGLALPAEEPTDA